jgi:2-polyprenyl-3-methyl-5-hydroxy-6-metoxy-1,4-benzoquinol methylase
MANSSLESIYSEHHRKRRGDFFLLLGEERGSFLKNRIGTGKKILDIGCRDGALTAYYAKGNTVLGVDIDGEALVRAKDSLGIETVKVDLNGDWREVSGNFDVVVAAEIIEHIYYPDVVVGKIASKLTPGGMLVGSVPHAFSFQNRLKYLAGKKKGTPVGDPTHINHFWWKEFEAILKLHFDEVEIVPIVSRKFALPNKLFKNAFTHTILFKAVKRKHDARV